MLQVLQEVDERIEVPPAGELGTLGKSRLGGSTGSQMSVLALQPQCILRSIILTWKIAETTFRCGVGSSMTTLHAV